MPVIDVAFARQVATSASVQAGREKLVNMYAEIETSAKNALIIRQRPGLRTVLAAAGEKRCIERNKGTDYAIIDDKFYSFDGYAQTLLGTIGTSSGRCTMIFDDNQNILISDGETGYYYDGSTLTTVTLPSGVKMGPLTSQSGFGIFHNPGTDQFYITGLNDYSSVDPLDFATAESQPDPLIRAFTDHNELWLFGDRTIEVWQLTGGTDFPFAPFTNVRMERGCAAAFSVAAEDDTVFWLGDDLIVHRADGYRPVPVSNPTVSRAFATLTKSELATGDAIIYTHEGEKFYCIRFPGKFSIQINIRTGAWNYMETYNAPDWKILGGAGKGQNYLLTDAGYSVLDASISQDDGGIMRRYGISAPLTAGGPWVSVRSFFLDAEVGRADLGVQSRVMMRVARDGETFGNERWRTLGPQGGYRRRPVWRNLGIGRDFSFEFAITDPVPFKIISSKANISVGR